MSQQTTPYAISSHIGSQPFGSNYVNAQVTGPLTTSNRPASMPYHNYGVLFGKQTPVFFYPSQEPINSAMNMNLRAMYNRATGISVLQKDAQDTLGNLSAPQIQTIQSSQRRVPISSHVNYIGPTDSSLALQRKTSIALGKSIRVPSFQPISTKSYDNTIRRAGLRRARSGGTVAPAKKGSIYNHTLSTSGAGWGAIPRANY